MFVSAVGDVSFLQAPLATEACGCPHDAQKEWLQNSCRILVVVNVEESISSPLLGCFAEALCVGPVCERRAFCS